MIVYKIQTNRKKSVIQAQQYRDTHYKSMYSLGIYDVIFIGWVHTSAYCFLPAHQPLGPIRLIMQGFAGSCYSLLV